MLNLGKSKITEHNDPMCWEIKNCRLGDRLRCVAFKAGKNCWEVKGTALDRGDSPVCETCPVILSRIARAIARAVSASPNGGAVTGW